MDRLKTNALQLTGVWQNGGISAKLNFCTSINISANLNICNSNPPTSPSPKTLASMLARHATKKQKLSLNNLFAMRNSPISKIVDYGS